MSKVFDGRADCESIAESHRRQQLASSLLSHLVFSKVVDAVPIERVGKQPSRHGADFASSTLHDWFGRCAEEVDFIKPLVKKSLLGSYLISLDDSPLPAKVVGHPNGMQRGRLWLYIVDLSRMGYCEFTPDWKGTHPQSVLANFNGQLQSDGYGGLHPLFKGKDPPSKVGCNDHARRKFFETMKLGDKRAERVIALYGALYAVEREVSMATPEVRLIHGECRSGPQGDPLLQPKCVVFCRLHIISASGSTCLKVAIYKLQAWGSRMRAPSPSLHSSSSPIVMLALTLGIGLSGCADVGAESDSSPSAQEYAIDVATGTPGQGSLVDAGPSKPDTDGGVGEPPVVIQQVWGWNECVGAPAVLSEDRTSFAVEFTKLQAGGSGTSHFSSSCEIRVQLPIPEGYRPVVRSLVLEGSTELLAGSSAQITASLGSDDGSPQMPIVPKLFAGPRDGAYEASILFSRQPRPCVPHLTGFSIRLYANVVGRDGDLKAVSIERMHSVKVELERCASRI